MKIDYTYNAELDILIATITGTYVISNDVKVVEQILDRLKEHRCTKILFDYREAEFRVEVLPAYSRPKVLEELGFTRTYRFASFYKKLDKDIRYTESVYRNRGWNMKDFTDIDEALNLLAAP